MVLDLNPYGCHQNIGGNRVLLLVHAAIPNAARRSITAHRLSHPPMHNPTLQHAQKHSNLGIATRVDSQLCINRSVCLLARGGAAAESWNYKCINATQGGLGFLLLTGVLKGGLLKLENV